MTYDEQNLKTTIVLKIITVSLNSFIIVVYGYHPFGNNLKKIQSKQKIKELPARIL